MNTYIASKVIKFSAGDTVYLTEEYAKRCASRIAKAGKPNADGFVKCQVKDYLQVKANQEFGYNEELPKVLADSIEPVKAKGKAKKEEKK